GIFVATQRGDFRLKLAQRSPFCLGQWSSLRAFRRDPFWSGAEHPKRSAQTRAQIEQNPQTADIGIAPVTENSLGITLSERNEGGGESRGRKAACVDHQFACLTQCRRAPARFDI